MYMNERMYKTKKQGTDQVSLKNVVVAMFIRRTVVQQAPVEALGKEKVYQNVLFVRYSLNRQLYMLIFVFPYLVKCLVCLAPFLSDRTTIPYILCSTSMYILVRSSDSGAVDSATGRTTDKSVLNCWLR